VLPRRRGRPPRPGSSTCWAARARPIEVPAACGLPADAPRTLVTARTLHVHVHVNTVHYRVRRIEQLTGRDLSDVADQADLRAALLCAPQPPRLSA
jgi:hypothetical protein